MNSKFLFVLILSLFLLSPAVYSNNELTTYDFNGKELTLDADADTSITADTDDEIDIEMGGVDRYTITGNTLVIEGTGADDASETTITFTNPTGDRAVTFPDAAVDLTEIGGSVNVLLETEIDASSELLAIMDDETGTGALVFANTPTLVTPVLGAATGTSIVLTGDLTSSDATDIGWSIVSGANTACSATCTFACVVGFDNGAADAEALVDCADTTADVCLCAGAN